MAYGSTVAGPFPFESATTNTTINFGISNHRDFDGTSIHQPSQTDWGVGISGLTNDLNHRKATSWDTQTVCLEYFTDNGSTMSSCMVPGSPYMTFTFKNAAVTINSMNGNLGNVSWVSSGKNQSVICTYNTPQKVKLLLIHIPVLNSKAQKQRSPMMLALIFCTLWMELSL